MESPIYPDFLENAEKYDASERFWIDLWNRVDRFARDGFGWVYPWVGTGSPLIRDGNPIFSAWSPSLHRGVRVIQAEPIDSELDIQMWLGTFGGNAYDPDSIHELVIACVLSEDAGEISFSLISQWVLGMPVSFSSSEDGVLLPSAGGYSPPSIVRRLGTAA